MDRLKLKYDSLCKALGSLNKSIEYINMVVANQQTIFPFKSKDEEIKTHNDSMIQRFEYSYDLFWKYLLKYLETLENIRPEIRSPKTVFREFFKIGLISDDCSRNLIKMVDDRNLTTHTYHEKLALEISAKIPGYYNIMNEITLKVLPRD